MPILPTTLAIDDSRPFV